MNKAAASKEGLIQIAREIACREGLSKLSISLAVFRKEFLEDLEGMEKAEKEKCRQTELFYANHIKAGMLRILCRDPRIQTHVWTPEFTREQLVEFTFSHMVLMLKEGRKDCGYLTQVLERLLYRAAEPSR